jgi:hypothetical protein
MTDQPDAPGSSGPDPRPTPPGADPFPPEPNSPLSLLNLTPGQLYTALIVVALIVVLLAFGIPNG